MHFLRGIAFLSYLIDENLKTMNNLVKGKNYRVPAGLVKEHGELLSIPYLRLRRQFHKFGTIFRVREDIVFDKLVKLSNGSFGYMEPCIQEFIEEAEELNPELTIIDTHGVLEIFRSSSCECGVGFLYPYGSILICVEKGRRDGYIRFCASHVRGIKVDLFLILSRQYLFNNGDVRRFIFDLRKLLIERNVDEVRTDSVNETSFCIYFELAVLQDNKNMMCIFIFPIIGAIPYVVNDKEILLYCAGVGLNHDNITI